MGIGRSEYYSPHESSVRGREPTPNTRPAPKRRNGASPAKRSEPAPAPAQQIIVPGNLANLKAIDNLANLKTDIKLFVCRAPTKEQNAPNSIADSTCLNSENLNTSQEFAIVQLALNFKTHFKDSFLFRINEAGGVGNLPASEIIKIREKLIEELVGTQSLGSLTDQVRRVTIEFITHLPESTTDEKRIKANLFVADAMSHENSMVWLSENYSKAVQNNLKAEPSVQTLILVNPSARKLISETAQSYAANRGKDSPANILARLNQNEFGVDQGNVSEDSFKRSKPFFFFHPDIKKAIIEEVKKSKRKESLASFS